MDGLNMGIIKAMPVLLPPLAVQHEYDQLQEELQNAKSRMLDGDGGVDNLFSSLQHRAFRGEL